MRRNDAYTAVGEAAVGGPTALPFNPSSGGPAEIPLTRYVERDGRFYHFIGGAVIRANDYQAAREGFAAAIAGAQLLAVPELPDVTIYCERLVALTGGEPLVAVTMHNPFVLRTVDPPLAALVGDGCRGASGWGSGSSSDSARISSS